MSARAACGVVAAVVVAAAAACDAPTVPARLDFYDFDSESNVVFHWPVASTIELYATPAATPELDALLVRSLESAITTWNAAALLGEYRLRRVNAPTSADAVLRWSSSPAPVVVPSGSATCNPEGGAASTVFCWVTNSDPMRIVTMRLPDGTPTRVRAVVTVLAFEAADTAQARRYFVHEVGHVLGIWGHSGRIEDVMHSPPLADELSAADRATIQVLYRTESEAVLTGPVD